MIFKKLEQVKKITLKLLITYEWFLLLNTVYQKNRKMGLLGN